MVVVLTGAFVVVPAGIVSVSKSSCTEVVFNAGYGHASKVINFRRFCIKIYLHYRNVAL